VTPYFQNDWATIYNADAIEVLEQLECDVASVITDPPYGSGARKEAQRSSSGSMVRGQRWAKKPIKNDQLTTTGLIFLLRSTLMRAMPLLRDGGSLLVFTDWRQWANVSGVLETIDARLNGMIVWDKMSMGLGSGFRLQHELIAHASKGVCDMHRKDIANVLSCKRAKNDEHPSPKPAWLMRQLIEATTPPGGLVLDPFMGGGATAEAAKLCGRKFVGVELDRTFCDSTIERIDRQMDLFA